MERIECDGTEWIGGKGREGGIERHDMVGSKIRSWREEAMGKSKLEMTGKANVRLDVFGETARGKGGL